MTGRWEGLQSASSRSLLPVPKATSDSTLQRRAIRRLSVHRPWKIFLSYSCLPYLYWSKALLLWFGTKLLISHLTVKSEGVSYSEWSQRDSLYWEHHRCPAGALP